MKEFNIIPVDRSLQGAIQEKIDNLNKPKGSLGRLEELAMQVCLVQQTFHSWWRRREYVLSPAWF